MSSGIDISAVQKKSTLVSSGSDTNTEIPPKNSPRIPILSEVPLVSTFDLPIGIRYKGAIQRELHLAPIAARMRKLIFSNVNLKNPGLMINTILSQCIKSIGNITEVNDDIVNNMTITDRTFALAKLKLISYKNSIIDFEAKCPECPIVNKKSYDIAKLPVIEMTDEMRNTLYKGEYCFSAENKEFGIKVKFRLPTGTDQCKLLKLGAENLIKATEYLIIETMLEWDTGNPDKSPLMLHEFEALPVEVVDWLVEATSNYNVGIDTTIFYDCLCGIENIPVNIDFLTSLFPKMKRN